jgi:hypothetical protein
MNGTTNISELPNDYICGSSKNDNITLTKNECSPSVMPMPMPPSNGNITLDQTTINQIVNGLQQASNSGSTLLPSRDIPIKTDNIVIDEQTRHDYLPTTNKSDYIASSETNEEIINNYNATQKKSDNIEYLYSEIQYPLLICIVYFLFQLPVFRKKLFYLIPFLFTNDGNYNINGYLITSILFGITIYMLIKIMNTVSSYTA